MRLKHKLFKGRRILCWAILSLFLVQMFAFVNPTYATPVGPVVDNFYIVPNSPEYTSSTPSLWAHAKDPALDIVSCKYRYMTNITSWSNWINGDYHPDTYDNYNDKVFGAGSCMSPDINVLGATSFSGEMRFINSSGGYTDSGIKTLSISITTPDVTIQPIITNNNPLPTISGTIDDPNAYIIFVDIHNGNGSIRTTVFYPTINDDGTWYGVVGDALPDGVYTMDVTASNGINYGYISGTYTVDSIAPSVPIHKLPSDNTFITTSLMDKITWDASSDQNGPITYKYQSSMSNATSHDGSFTSPVYTSQWLNNTSIPTPNTPEGVYYWHVKAKDTTGNESSWSSPWKITVDNTAPTALLDFNLGTGPTAKGFSIVFNEQVNPDEASNSENYFLNNWPGADGSGNLSGNATIVYDNQTNTAKITFSNPNWYVSPEQQWGVKNIHDLAGNMMGSTEKHSTTMVPPETTAILSGTEGPNGVYKTDVVINFNATDPSIGSGVKSTYYKIDDNQYIISTFATVSSDGDHILQYYSIDNAGNSETVKTISFTIDQTPPVISLVGGPIELNKNETFKDPGYSTDDGSPVIVSGDVDISNPGTYILTYESIDATGNKATSVTRTVQVLAPVVLEVKTATPTAAITAPSQTIALVDNSDTTLQDTENPNDTAVLGEQTTNTNTKDVKGSGDTKKTEPAKSTGFFESNTFGLPNWAWSVIAGLGIAGGAWWLFALRRSGQN